MLLVCSFAFAETAPPAIPEPPSDLVSQSHQLNPTQLAAPWDALIHDLQQKGDISATFTENRYLPLKKIPVVLTGEIRLSREHGLSLHYLTPEERTIIVDTQGLQMRNAAGKSRDIASDPRATESTAAIMHVMRFDLAELSKQFTPYAAGDRARWFFAFEPRNDTLSKSLSRIVVTGENDKVRRITMRRGAVEILIGETRENVTFTPEELQRFFR